jgi:hypothetical protein
VTKPTSTRAPAKAAYDKAVTQARAAYDEAIAAEAVTS